MVSGIPRNRLAEFRKRSNLTQIEVGKLIDVDPTIVSKHENRERNLTDEMAGRYARVYKCQTHEIFFALPEGDVAVNE